MSHTEKNAFKKEKAQIHKPYKLFSPDNAHAGKLSIIEQPKRILEVSVPVLMDDGTTKVYTAFRAQHNDARGPFK